MKLKFNITYFLWMIFTFLVEVLIATKYKHFVFIRSYLGDVIVVILIYFFVHSFFNIKNNVALIFGIFLFSVLIEVLQYLKIAEILHLKPGSVAHIVVGSSFSWWDILCYFVGCILLLIFSRKKKSNPL